jgi:hypothetical protein
MHKIYDYVCKELKELEDKAEKGLTAADIEYADKLAELKKNILKIRMLENGGYSYYMPPHESYREGPYEDHSYGSMYRSMRDRRPMNYGYSRSAGDIVYQLEDMAETAPDEMTRREIHRLIDKMRNA